MPVFEITQAGINSVNMFDPDGNLPTGNFNYFNAYNVDPTTFNKDDFKALTTWAAQSAYLASTTTGARNGYATPPNFPYQGNSVPLIRVGNAGSVPANQVAQRVNKVSVDQTNYNYLMASGYGNFYFNLIVVYNTYGVASGSKPTQADMPIAFIYLFDGIQNKLQNTKIELNAVLQYAGLSSTIEFPINPIVSAGLLEVTLPDLLPIPSAASTNNYLIRNPSPSSVNIKSTATTANLCNYDISGGGDNVLLWQFDTHTTFFDTTVASDVNNTPTRTALADYRFNSTNKETQSQAGYIMQVLTGDFIGQCRRVTDIQSDHITWATNFGNVLPNGTVVRIHIPNRIRMQTLDIPTTDQSNFNYAIRASETNITGYSLFYDGMGNNSLMDYPHASLNTFTNAKNARYLVGTSSHTGLPSGFGSIGCLEVTTIGSGRFELFLVDLTNGNKYTRTVYDGVFDSGWQNTGDSFQYINNVSDLPVGETVFGQQYITNAFPQAVTSGTRDSDNNSIIITRGNKDFMWSFSTHSNIVAMGSVTAVDNSGPTNSIVDISVSSGTAIANWNLDTTIDGDPVCRFIIQFRKAGDNTWTGVARGFAVSNVNTGASELTIYPKVPAFTSGVEFVVLECNLSTLRKKTAFTFTHINNNTYVHIDPTGLTTMQTGLITVPAAGATFTLASLGLPDFSTVCYSVNLQQAMPIAGNETWWVTAKTTSSFSVDHGNGGDVDYYVTLVGR